ncbi:MAG: N-acetyltransferase [Planctomycetota bacterium]
MIRKARLGDVQQIHRLVNRFADEGLMLGRSLSELYDNLRDFSVAPDGPPGGDGRLLGCCCLHITWEGLAEVRSLAVVAEAQGRGLGRRLVEACLAEARELGIARVFALTYRPEFFGRLGFRPVDKAELPHKVWADCVKCPKFPDCDEVAVAIELD